MLGLFAQDAEKALNANQSYVESGFGQGRREDLAGGGFVRSLGGWSEITHQRQKIKGNQGILGENEFVLRILAQANENYERRYLLRNRG